jgi:hypothetical protein
MSANISNTLPSETSASAKPQVIKAKQNKFGNYCHEETGFVFDPRTERVLGKQTENGDIKQLTADDLKLCQTMGAKTLFDSDRGETHCVSEDDHFLTASAVRSDELDHELMDAIVNRASEQVSAMLLKQRAKEREENQKRRTLWQEERRLFNQNNALCLERITRNQDIFADEIRSRNPLPKFWFITSEFLKGVALVSAIWYFWKGAVPAPLTPR